MLCNGGTRSAYNTKNNDKHQHNLNQRIWNKEDLTRKNHLINYTVHYLNQILTSKNNTLQKFLNLNTKNVIIWYHT